MLSLIVPIYRNSENIDALLAGGVDDPDDHIRDYEEFLAIERVPLTVIGTEAP